MPDAADTIREILKQEEPIKEKFKPLFEGDTFVHLMKKLEKERRDASVRTNYKFCRKKCKFFKSHECYKKSYDEQCKCCESKTYLTFTDDVK